MAFSKINNTNQLFFANTPVNIKPGSYALFFYYNKKTLLEHIIHKMMDDEYFRIKMHHCPTNGGKKTKKKPFPTQHVYACVCSRSLQNFDV